MCVTLVALFHSHIKYCFINVVQKLKKSSSLESLPYGSAVQFEQGAAGVQCNVLSGCRFSSMPMGTHSTERALEPELWPFTRHNFSALQAKSVRDSSVAC